MIFLIEAGGDFLTVGGDFLLPFFKELGGDFLIFVGDFFVFTGIGGECKGSKKIEPNN